MLQTDPTTIFEENIKNIFIDDLNYKEYMFHWVELILWARTLEGNLSTHDLTVRTKYQIS